MGYNKERYHLLRDLGGFTSKEATRFASRSTANVKALIENNILHRLDMSEKVPKKLVYKMAKFFGFNVKDATRIKGFSIKNIAHAFSTRAVPAVGDLVVSRAKDGINILSAYEHGRYQQKKYLYEVEYFVDTGFNSTKKFVTVTSNKKLSKKQVFNHIVETQFPKHEEDYESIPMHNTIKITNAYYITASEQRKILNKRDEKQNEKQITTRNKSREK
jgi:hypothetical protein